MSVQLFSFDTKFLQRLGDKEEGEGIGQFRSADGICVVQDRLYVSDFKNSRIQVFSIDS